MTIESLFQRLSKRLDIEAAAAFEPLQTLRNLTAVYRLRMNCGDFVIKRDRQDADNSIAEVDFSSALTACGFTNFAPALRRFNDEESGTNWTLYPFVSGSSLTPGMFEERAESIGGLLSRYHAASRFSVRRWRALSTGTEIAKSWAKNLGDLPGRPCIAHGDFRPDNLILTHDGSLVFIDFEFRRVVSPIVDLVSCRLSSISKDGYTLLSDQGYRKFLSAYGELAEDEEAMNFCNSALFDRATANYYKMIACQVKAFDAPLAEVCLEVSRRFLT